MSLLEDDSFQAGVWQALVEGETSYAVSNVCQSPGQISIPTDGNFADFYLLDIQNGDNPEAGIEIAERLFAAYVKIYGAELGDKRTAEDAIREKRMKPLKIILFSSSLTSVENAKKRLRTAFGSHKKLISQLFGSSSTGDPIIINVQAKSSFSANYLDNF